MYSFFMIHFCKDSCLDIMADNADSYGAMVLRSSVAKLVNSLKK